MSYAAAEPRRRQDTRIDLGLALSVVVVALALRLPTLDRFITPDELKWVCRSVSFHSALRSGNYEETLQTGHPGVLTMWVGVPAMGGELQGESLRLCASPRLSDAVAQRTSREPAELAGQLFLARRGVAVLTALAMGLACWLLIRLLGRGLALPAVVLLLGDPFLLAHSRLLHLDGITASFALLSLLALAVALREDRARFLVASGVCAGLAALNKSPAMVIAPFTALALGVATLGWRRPLPWLIRSGLIWIAAAAATYVLVWPAMWVRPWHTFTSVLDTATYYAGTPHSNDNYFLNAIRPDPGPAFYPVALAFRLTPWAALGLLVALPLAWRRNEHRPLIWLFGAYGLVYLLFMTSGAKKFDRYVLPAFGPLDVIAAVGLSSAVGWGLRRWRQDRVRWGPASTAALLAVLAVGTVLPHAPYYLTYYNPLLGGARSAVRVLLVGWGEGMDEAVRHLNALPDAESRRGVARALPAFAALFDGEALDASDYDAATTHYVVLYLNEVQRRLSPELMERYYDVAEALHVARVRGIDYAWVYANTSYQPPMEHIAAHANPATDAIVVSRSSLFDEHYRGAPPLYVVPDGDNEAAMYEALNRAAEGAERVWFVRYDEHDGAHRLDWLDFQWKTHARLLSQRAFTDVSVSLWQTRPDATFGPPAGERVDVGARFGDILELVAYTPLEPASRWGSSVGLVVEWRALRQPDRYYSLALYVVDEHGRIWGQGDRWIVDQAMRPTAFWQDGAAARDRVTVELAAGIPPGTYRLQAEVYDRLGRERLEATGADSEDPVRRIDVSPLVVASSSFVPRPEELGVEPHDMPLLPGLALVGWRVQPEAVRFDESLSITLGWQARDALDEDYAAHVELLDVQGNSWAEATCAPAGDAYPTSRWQVGETLQYPCHLHVSFDAPASPARLELTLLDTMGQAVTEPLALDDVQLKGHRFDLPSSARAQEARLGEAIRFRGFELARDAIKPGETLEFSLYWQREGEIAKSCKVFAHLVDASHVIRAQQDNAPMEGRYPTDRWQPGEVVEDNYAIHVPLDTPEGDLRLLVGMYDPEGAMTRLPLLNGEGVRQPNDCLQLAVTIRVAP